MIATGGLLRINARRQDSLSRPHKPHAQKKKKKKKRSEVVVVKGKLKLCSVSGLVAALGILVLVVGVVMAALGYWPRDGLFFSSQPQEGTAMASVSSDTPTTAPADAQVRHYTTDTRQVREGVLQSDDVRDNGGSDDGFNQTETINGTTRHLSQGFLQDFLDRYLYSDRLKVFGPLIMGIGIFLFICANAVLHENRDKKTKVINLRDIYSTVIDLHSLRKPNTSSCSANPPNSIVNYIQSKSLEAKPRAYPDSLINRKGGGEGVGDSGVGGGLLTMQPGSSKGAGEGWGNDGGGHAVFSIYQEQTDAPPPSSSQRLSLPQSFSPTHPSTCWTTKNMLSSFTLPLRRPKPPALQRRHSARARTNQGWKGEEDQQRWDRGDDKPGEEGYGCPSPPQRYSSPPLNRPLQDSITASCSSSGLYKEAPEGSQALLLLSSSSLTPSHLSLSSFSSTPLPPCRRHSLSTSIIITGYSKLKHRDNDSCSPSSHKVISQGRHQMSEEVKSQRKYSNKEKLRMISQKYSGLTQKKDQSGLDSETDSTTQYMSEKH
ncbi:transmembrane protein 200C-like isoform X2 [Neolamprologus brichardi]|uniref:transmembrane protein 200C-like isoform X2 n=1 Tax=Neolamprologus brichardi TaxID=32507 RepID=UPI001643BC44|nr:transmembrane protein 200C-like isoform X2 [Neolamprologus brichardi]